VRVKLHNLSQSIGADIDTQSTGGVGAQAIRMRCGSGPTSPAIYLADRICDVVQSALSSHGINSTCTHGPIGSGERITLTLRDALSNPIPLDFAIFDVRRFSPVLISPFTIGPVTAFYNANLAVSGGALVSPVGLSGNDGATVTSTVPTPIGMRLRTSTMSVTSPNISVTTRAWGVLAGQPNQLLGSARIQRNGPGADVTADFSMIGATNVRVDVYYNTALKATMTVPAGLVAQIAPNGPQYAAIRGCGGRPTQGPNNPFLWFDLDQPYAITPNGGSPVTGNQIRVTAGTGALNAQNIQCFDVASGRDNGTDIGSFVIFSSVEGGICYCNIDGSTTPPILNALDFGQFLNLYAAGDPLANCDGSELPPVLNTLDFGCFLNAYAAGCS
jgi:hypothetical protein